MNKTERFKDKKVALALGGGAVLGAAHIGVIKALEEFGMKITAISGTSAGAIVAALYAFGKSADEIEKIVLDFEWKKLSSITISKFAILSNKKIGEIIKLHIGEKTFQEASIPLAMIATDISSGAKVIMDKGIVCDAVVATTCIPGVFVPVELYGLSLVDGGIVENVPLSCLKKDDADFVIGVDLISRHVYKKPNNFIEVLHNSFGFLVKANKSFQTKDADILIEPDLNEFNAIDMSQIGNLTKKGYEETKRIINNL